MKKLLATAAAIVLATGTATGTALAEQGVTDTEVVLGSHNDLSGPFAAFGAPAMKAAQMYFDEINEKGGVHGRKIRLVVEDHGYQVPKAVQAANKLINRDKVFAMFMGLGTPHNLAAFKLQERKNIPNFLPLSAARQMLDDPIGLKFVSFSSYYDGIRTGLKYMKENEGSTTVCPMYIPSDFGKEIAAGAKDEAEALGMTYAAETTHKPDETDYVGSLTKLKDAGCDLIPIALSIRGVITAVATAKKLGWTDVKFLGSSAAFHTAIAKVPGGVTDGFYAAAGWQDLEARAGDPAVGSWIKTYTEATGEKFPGTGAMLGRSAAEAMVRALEAAGPDLTVESFVKAMEGMAYTDAIMGAAVDYGPDHLGSNKVFISQVQGGSWVVVGEAGGV
ncbi:MAG: ABC transporter substrate-binding protein [Pseudomonadota bacterium]